MQIQNRSTDCDRYINLYVYVCIGRHVYIGMYIVVCIWRGGGEDERDKAGGVLCSSIKNGTKEMTFAYLKTK